MIIREIKICPFEVLSSFDWFNDYDDTLQWAKNNPCTCPPEITHLLEAGYKVHRMMKAADIKRTHISKENSDA